MIYAYVTNECCTITRACRPGSAIDPATNAPSRDGWGKDVSRHGDWYPWIHGKRETLRLATAASGYTGRVARAVLTALDWEPTCKNENCTLDKHHLGKCEVSE